MKKKTTRRKIGKLLAGLIAGSLSAARKPKQAEAQALLAGTVFRDSGFALAGVEVLVRLASGGKPKWKAVSDARGEFHLRLPSGPASYTVSVKAKGFRTQEKSVTYAADERYDLTFLMEPESTEAK